MIAAHTPTRWFDPSLRRAFVAALALISVVAFEPDRAIAQSAAEKSAMKTAGVLVDKAHGALANTGLSEGQKFSRLQSAVKRTFAFSVWEEFLLGKNAEKFSSKQRSTFRKLLPQYLAKLYMNQFGRGLRNKPEIVSAKTVRRDVLVRARIPRASGGRLPVDWRLRRVGGGYRVIDFMVGGTSFLVLKRAEFNSVIRRSGPDALNAFLQNFIA
ncbi:MAG: ABC transporter substrate-binding protein [Pseudomonadota bacterium]